MQAEALGENRESEGEIEAAGAANGRIAMP
jgi:hypothetical protein